MSHDGEPMVRVPEVATEPFSVGTRTITSCSSGFWGAGQLVFTGTGLPENGLKPCRLQVVFQAIFWGHFFWPQKWPECLKNGLKMKNSPEVGLKAQKKKKKA